MAEHHPRTLYTKELIRKGRGYPFWYPEPDSSASAEFKERGVHPGDVGILNNDGGFDFLFSIFSDANSLINAGHAPPGFQPLSEPTSRDIQIYPAHGDVLKTQHVFCREVSVDASVQGLQSIADTGVSFDVSITEASAAILFLPNYSMKYEALNKALIEDYARRHGVSWYNYVNGMLGRKAPNGSLYLVTGCDKTTTWGNAVVGRTDRSFAFSLKCTLASTGGVTIKVANSWVGDSGVEKGLFPNPLAHYSYPTDRENQCVFARGFTISISESLFNKSGWKSVPYHLDGSSKDRVPSFDTKNAPLPLSNGKTGFWAHASSFFGFGAVLEEPDSNQSGMLAESVDDRSLVAKVSKFPPGESELLNPSVAVNEYLLNMDPSLEIVILHDEEWMKIMRQYEDTYFTEEMFWHQVRGRLIDAKLSKIEPSKFKLPKFKLPKFKLPKFESFNVAFNVASMFVSNQSGRTQAEIPFKFSSYNAASMLVLNQSGRGQAEIEPISEIRRLEDLERRLANLYGMMNDPIDSAGVFAEAKTRALFNRDSKALEDVQKLDRLLHLRLRQ